MHSEGRNIFQSGSYLSDCDSETLRSTRNVVKQYLRVFFFFFQFSVDKRLNLNNNASVLPNRFVFVPFVTFCRVREQKIQKRATHLVCVSTSLQKRDTNKTEYPKTTWGIALFLGHNYNWSANKKICAEFERQKQVYKTAKMIKNNREKYEVWQYLAPWQK